MGLFSGEDGMIVASLSGFDTIAYQRVTDGQTDVRSKRLISKLVQRSSYAL